MYGYRKMHAALARERITVGEDQVRCLMARAGLQGAVRGRAWTITTSSTPGAPRAVDLVERQFRAPAPNRLWVSDFERHEAPLNRAVVKGHRLGPVAAGS